MDSGLRKRPTYNELINYIERDIKIKLPNRQATFLRNSPYFTQLDNFVDTDHQDRLDGHLDDIKKANQQAAKSGQTASVTRSQTPPNNPVKYHDFNIGTPPTSNPNVSFQIGGSSSSQGQEAGSFIPNPSSKSVLNNIYDTVIQNLGSQPNSAKQFMDTTGSTKREAPPDVVDTIPKAKAKAGGLSIPIPKAEDDVIDVLFPKSKFDAVALNTLSKKNAKLDPSTEPKHWQIKPPTYIKDQLILQGHRISQWESENYNKQDFIKLLAHNKPDEALTPRGPKEKPKKNQKGFQIVTTDKITQEIAALQKQYPGSSNSLHGFVRNGKTVDEALSAYIAKPTKKPKNKNKR